MSTNADTFMSRIVWDTTNPFTTAQKNTITSVLTEILATVAGRALVNDFTVSNATINIVNSYGQGSHETTSVVGGVTTYTLRYDFAQIGSTKYVNFSNSVSTADAAEVITHEFTHMSGLTDYFSDTNPDLISRMIASLGVPPYQAESPNVEFTNIIKDQMRVSDPSISPDRISYSLIGSIPSSSDFASGSTFSSDPNANDFVGVSIPSYSGVVHLDQSDDSLLLGSETGGASLDLDFGGWSNVSSASGGGLDITLSSPAGSSFGVLAYNPSGASFITLSDGAVVALSSLPTSAVVLSPLSVGTTAENTLVAELVALGDTTTAAALDIANYNYLNPTGTAYTISDGGTDTFYVENQPPGAVVTGHSGATNTVIAIGDISSDTITNIQELQVDGNAEMTGAEFNSFASITGGTLSNITITTSGSYSLGAATNIVSLTAQDWGGTTLTGNGAASEYLTASLFGNDTLNAGNGAGDGLVAGEGVDTLVGGTGGDTFVVANGLATGSIVTGNGTGNTLSLTGLDENISGATITGVQTLTLADSTELTLTSAEISAFTTITGTGGSTTINADGGGTYSMASATLSDSLTMNTDATANTILIGNAGVANILSADDSSGSNHLSVSDTSSGGGSVLSANGSSGSNMLTAGNGVGDVLDAEDSTGSNDLTGGNGGDLFNDSGSTGHDTLAGGSGADTFTLGNGMETVTGGGGGDTIYVDGGLASGSSISDTGTGNVLEVSNTQDLSTTTISGVSTLYDSNSTLTLTGAAFNQFSNLDNEIGGTETLVIVGTGTYSLTGKTVSGTFSLITDSGSSISGNNANGQVLYAPSTGTSTVTAGSGTGDTIIAGGGTDTLNAGSGGNVLVAGTGTDTMTGGSGNDTFVVGNSLASGDTLNGGTGTNAMQITAPSASIASATISNITALEVENGASTTLTHTQFGLFTTYTADAGAGAVSLSGAGTYSLASDTVYGTLALTATGTGNYTLTGNNTANQTINGNSGSSSADTIATGTGTEDTVNANGTNDFVTLNGTYGTANINDASGAWTNVNGANDLVNDYGSGDTINASGTYAWINSNGGSQSITTTSTSSYDTVNINGSSTWANITGSNDTINADGSYDNVTLNGSTDWVYINASHVTVALDGASGNVTAVTGASSTNAWINMNANNNVVTLNGTNGSATASSGYSNDWINVNGTGNVATLSGTGDTAYLTGAAEDAWVNVGGSGNGTNGTGTGNTFNMTASSNTVGGGDDTFIVANGLSETLNGGQSDTYEFGSTFGSVSINNTQFGSTTTANGKLTFGSGVTDEKLWFQQSGNNLIIDLLDTTDQITVDNWFGSNAGAQLSEIDAGSLKLTTAVTALVNAMATYASGHTGFNPQTATSMPTDTTLQNAITASWHS